MFQKILIANRGEIALRIIRTCREMGIRTVAVYSSADRDSLHVRYADQDICIGPGPSKLSYLNIAQILSAAEITDVDAIHPGYGFLAENADFAQLCEQCKIKFIGPSSEAIRKMGDKNVARKTAKDNKIPLLPGSDGPVKNPEEARVIANKIGFPVIIKASAGGGGRGMRIAHTEVSLPSAFQAAQNEAEAAFGNGEVYIEKYLLNPRHVEIQILGDSKGNIIHLGERDCSTQRRHQKLIEESPSPGVDDKLRRFMGDAAVKIAKAVNYEGLGTVEFLVDGREYYFMEMNTRIQVEHPVTEEVIGLDMVRQQLLVASGEKLTLTQKMVQFRGHAIEFRINAEDPDKNFTPSPGKITAFHVPGGLGVRVDTHAYDEYVIPPFYDSMIAKLIIHAGSRDEALKRAARALDEFVIEGIKTTIPFHQMMLRNEKFLSGNFTTNSLAEILK
ncbi:acetyl-CoA carboxylase biotin carboxylase subunit [Candidatus Sumerlaeota bacterium]|nr:acetyl-CoA carboxylase biotin carboxylase subunit [Candidatus Sumerlaeota bacterium]MBI3735789.1 acetyl-CoA carboxylase biotin carboxylase subunit [Candidatus Sumerlaeota bacterium]